MPPAAPHSRRAPPHGPVYRSFAGGRAPGFTRPSGWSCSASAARARTAAAGGLTRNDPLIGNSRIPPTSVPVPDRGGLGSRGRADPLLGSPTGGAKDKAGATRPDDDRWKGPYIPSSAATPAALSAKLQTNHSDLTLDAPPPASGGVRLQPAGGLIPAAAQNASRGGDGVPQVLQDDLAELGVKRGGYDLSRGPGGEYAVRASVPNAAGADQPRGGGADARRRGAAAHRPDQGGEGGAEVRAEPQRTP